MAVVNEVFITLDHGHVRIVDGAGVEALVRDSRGCKRSQEEGSGMSPLSKVPYILSHLTEDDVEWLLAAGEQREIPPCTMLIAEGQLADVLFIVLDGVLSVSIAALDGREINRVGAGDIIGEISFADARPPSASVTALNDVVVFALARETLAAKVRLDTGFAARFYHALTVFLSDRLRLFRRQTTGWQPNDNDTETDPEPHFLANVHLAGARFDRLLNRMRNAAIITLTGNDLSIENVVQVAYQHAPVQLSSLARDRMVRSRAVVDELAQGPDPIYGLTTGLGALKGLRITTAELPQFQRNILLSHAAGVGPDYGVPVVRAIMLARLNGFARGGAGIQPAVFDLLLALLNARIHPIVPSRGSVGMGDLTALAHLALPLIGLGEVDYQGQRLPALDALTRAELRPVQLAAKDGLALCGSNSASVGHGALVLAASLDLLACADIAAALSLEAFQGSVSLFSEGIHTVRPYSGQLASAERMRLLLAGSGLWSEVSGRSLQDPLSLRCIAQVHGACRDVLSFVRSTVETELNATSDNPIVLPDENRIVSNGNFHPGGLAMAFDTLAIALAQLSSLAASRVLRLMDPDHSHLPPQLTPQPGVNSGFGVLQKTVTALNAETRFLAGPASLDFMTVANDIEDHATMTTRCVSKADQIVENSRHVLAIELLSAAQAVDLRDRPIMGVGTRAAYEAVRSVVPFMAVDQYMAPAVEAVYQLVAPAVCWIPSKTCRHVHRLDRRDLPERERC
jgi:histidine ammonia-lyase